MLKYMIIIMNLKLARMLVKITSKLSITYCNNKIRYSMQFIADIFKRLCDEKQTLKEELYYVHHWLKIRYIDPLLSSKRISKCCKLAQKNI